MSNTLLDNLILYRAMKDGSYRVWNEIVKELGLESTASNKDALLAFDLLSDLATKDLNKISIMDIYRQLSDIKERNNVTTANS